MEVTISDTTFWKTWNTLRDLECFFIELDLTELSPEKEQEAIALREAVGWRLNNLTPAMQYLKENETDCQTVQE